MGKAPRTLRRRRTSVLDRLLFFFGLFLIVTGIFGFYAVFILSPVGPPDAASRRLSIPARSTAAEIASLLREEGLVRSDLAFRAFVRYKGFESGLKAGEYELSPALSTPAIVERLFLGRQATQRFTVPEGYNTAQIAAILGKEGLVDPKAFLDEVATGRFSHPFLQALPQGPRRLEGYLFPDTYAVTRDLGPHRIIDCMLARFAAESERLDLAAGAERVGLDLHQAVILASLIEREARRDDERRLISGVLHNRLRLGMPLQVDATVLYALGRTAAYQVTLDDLKVDSPYNTYRITGLPPGPIANPGAASLAAAVNPARTPYLYYVAKPDGSHAFARTLEEHNRNKALYQR
ncbi:MAG: endolytic transglycosylase MltG [Bacillota bacterium]|nr:endolytic transglycosylase MltG [Bacillota bacterium]